MKKLSVIIVLSFLALASCGGSKKAPLFWLAGLTQSNGSGGNEGIPVTTTTQDPVDPPPGVTPTGTDQTCAPIDPPPSPSVQDILNQQVLTGDGTTTSPDMFVDKGVLVGNLNCGKMKKEDGTRAQVVLNGAINGSFVVRDPSGAVVNGQTMVIADDFVFIPSTRLISDSVYTITFNLTGAAPFTEKIYMAVDNTCQADSLFKKAVVYGADANPVIKDSAIVDNNGAIRSIVGWDFSKGRFYMNLQNKTAGAKYILTLYGVYDIPGHGCEVYFQRFASAPYNPVENLDITGWGQMLVDETDSSIPNPAGGNYSFAKTYIQLKVYDESNNDITTTDTGSVQLQLTSQKVAASTQSSKALSGAPMFQPPEKSSLSAFLGRSSTNVMILALILIVGAAGLLVTFAYRKKNKIR